MFEISKELYKSLVLGACRTPLIASGCPGADWLTGLTGADGEILQFDPSLLEDEPAKGEKT